MRSGRTQDQINNMAHRRYTIWATGDGAKTDFPIGKNITRLDDLCVFVAGLLLRPFDKGTAYDYRVRGLSDPVGYIGDANTVRIVVAPAVNVNICFIVNAD